MLLFNPAICHASFDTQFHTHVACSILPWSNFSYMLLCSLFSLRCDFALIFNMLQIHCLAGDACWHTLNSEAVYPNFSILVVYLTMLVCHQCNAYWNVASVQLCMHLNEGWCGTFSDKTATLFFSCQVAVPISGPFNVWSSSMVLASTSSFHPLLLPSRNPFQQSEFGAGTSAWPSFISPASFCIGWLSRRSTLTSHGCFHMLTLGQYRSIYLITGQDKPV